MHDRYFRTLVVSAALAVAFVASARGADAPDAAVAVLTGEDASISVTSPAGELMRSLRLALASLDGTPATVARTMDFSSAVATLGRATYRLSAGARALGAGALVEFDALPHRRRPSDDAEPVRASVLAELAPGSVMLARLIGRLDAGDEVAALTPDGFAAVSGPARGIEIAFVDGRVLTVESEFVTDVRLGMVDDRLVLRLADALFEKGARASIAIYVGMGTYAGRPVIVGEPRVSFLPGHECFEAEIRAFGPWSDPFDAGVVALDALWRDGGEVLTSAGFFARDHASRVAGEGKAEREVVEPRGFGAWRVRVPASAGGSVVSLRFATAAGVATSSVRLPVADARDRYAPSAGVALSPPGTRGTEELADAIKTLVASNVHLARVDARKHPWALSDAAGRAIDLQAAWLLDKVIAFAGTKGVSIILRPFDEPELDLTGYLPTLDRPTRYAAARWGPSRAFAGWQRPIAGPVETNGDDEAGAWERSWCGYTLGTAGMETHDEIMRSLSENREADHCVIDTVGRAARHGKLWTAAAVSRSNLLFGETVELDVVGPLVRFLDAVPEGAGFESSFFFRSTEYGVRGARGGRGAKWWMRSLAKRRRAAAGAGDDDDGAFDDEGPEPIRAAEVVVGGLETGEYRVEWWQTYEGVRLTSAVVKCRDGTLRLTAPPFLTDVAGFAVRTDGRER